MLKLADNPPLLSSGVQSITDLSGRWWVAHTKSRFEKAFAWDLAARNIGYFLPLIERTTISSGKKRRVMAPLFQSYVFFCGTEEDRYIAMTTNRLCQVIPVRDQAAMVAELSAIEWALKSNMQLDPYSFAVVGKRCRVRKGPLQGIEGVVIERNRQTHLVLQVSMLGQGAALEISADLLEPLD